MKMKKREKKSGGRGMCAKNGSYCEKEKSRGGGGVGGQGRCELCENSKKKKKYLFFYFFLGGGSGWGGGIRVDVN